MINSIAKPYFNVCNDILKHRYTHYWLKGGRGSTKSSFISLEVVVTLIQHKDVNALVLRQVGATLKDSVYNQILWAIEKLNLSVFFKATISPLEITYKPTGQKIFFRGADDPIKIKSIKPKQGYIGIVWLEELDQFHGMEAVRSILQSANRGGETYWNFYSFNPPKSRDNWVNVEVQEEEEGKIVLHTTFETIPVDWLGQHFFDEAEKLKKKNEMAYDHEYLGLATGTGGTIFENLEEREITQEEIDDFREKRFGIDFGYAQDPFSFVSCNFNAKKNTIYLYDEIYGIKKSNKKAVSEIIEKGYQDSYITAESAEPKSIAEFNELGLRVMRCKKGKDSVSHGIKWIQDLDCIVIDKKKCPNTYREFSCYEYRRDRYDNFISDYPDKNNHTIDAVRYAVEDLSTNRSIKWG